MLHENDIQGAESRFATAFKMIKNAHIDPNWEYNIEYNDSGMIITEVPKNESILEGLPQKIITNIIIPDEYRHFNNMDEIIKYGQEKQIIVSFELNELKRYAGERLIEHIKPSDGGKLIMEIPPVPFPIIHSKFIFGEGMFEYNAWFQITQIVSDGVVEISNKNQPDKIIQYKFIIDVKNGTGSFNVFIPEEQRSNVESNLLFTQIMYLSNKGIELNIYSNEYENTFFTTNLIFNDGEDLEVLESNLGLLKIISNIEKAFNIKLRLPEMITQDDYETIYKLKQIINHGRINVNLNELNADFTEFDGLRECIEKTKERKPIRFTGTIIEEFILFEHTFSLEVELHSPAIFVKDWEIVERKLEVVTPGDQIKVTLIPASEDTTATYIYKKFHNKY